MRINKLEVDGFRSFSNFRIIFDDALTLIVGENDSGKTSLIECLKVVTQGRVVTPDDFTYGHDEMSITVEIDDFIFKRNYQRDGESISEVSFNAFPTDAYLETIIMRVDDVDFDLTNEENQLYIKEIGRNLGFPIRANTNLGNLRGSIIEKIRTREGDLVIDNAVFPKFNSIQLDGRQFEDVPAFFKEVFFKEKQASIWNENIDKETTIEDFVRTHLKQYSEEVSKQIRERGILGKLQIFLRDLTEIKVEPLFHARDLNVDAKVKFLENGTEISIDKKGDGTRRRITMALLEFKKEQSLVPNDDKTMYLLDEPDTHLHVKAQLDLVETVESFASTGNQVILTTHSPFIVNAAKPSQVRLLENNNGQTRIKFLKDDPVESGRILRSLGIENTHLFFSRQILIVEGETEEQFIPAYYLSQTQHTISSALVKVINVQGVHNIAGFAKAVLELHDPQEIYILCDNDISTELRELINSLQVQTDHVFYVGTQEFEDAFNSEVLHRCWSNYHTDCDRKTPTSWTATAIEDLKQTCIEEGKKFSTELRKLNEGGKKMRKPQLGNALGSYIFKEELPQEISQLFRTAGII